ncbi:DUF3574 domain-containing protein [Streptomyces sp. NPDC127110]|uniref:DUF3574 domain-containing protein n=1 Tax=Streptomyces sp. NPDC127110 TaxID=3345362 RepID=UPI00362C065B
MTWTSDKRGKAGGGVLLALLGAGIPALVGAALHGPTGEPYRETRLHFAAQRPDGREPVAKGEFTRFLDREVTPAFPEGLTLRDTYRQWRADDGAVVREPGYEVVLLYPRTEADERGTRVERIRRQYEKQFRQHPVRRVDDEVQAGF